MGTVKIYRFSVTKALESMAQEAPIILALEPCWADTF